MNPALQFLARFLSATVQVLSKSGSTCASLGDGPNIIRKAETYGRSPLQLESSYINPSPKSHNPPPPLILRSHSFSWSETLTSICVALQEILFMLLLMTRDYVGDVSCKAPWQTFTAFEAGSALPQRPRNVPAAGRPLAF